MADLVDFERAGELAILRMRAGKANALTAPLLDAIERGFDAAEHAGVAAVVLTGDGKAFSAGLALPELYDLDRAAMRGHIARFEAVMRRVLAFPRATVAMIDGHAIAGGCVLALMCDARLVRAGGTLRIGLNEVQLGIGLPAIVVEPLRTRVAPSRLAPIALEGRLFDAREAVEVGLADAAGTEADAVERARALGHAPVAYAQIKAALVRPVLAALDRDGPAEREAWLDTWFAPRARELLGAAVARLAARK
jgi:enoyl-CoA hydratase/carnithine racemase